MVYVDGFKFLINMNITYTIARYENLSSYFLVAFNICAENGDCAYIESYVPLTDIVGKTSQEICQLGYDQIKDQIQTIKQKFESNAVSIVGYQFIPQE